MKLNRTLISSALTLVLMCSTSALQASGVPVADGLVTSTLQQLNMQNDMKEQAYRTTDWAKTMENWSKNYEWYSKQYENLRSGNYVGLITDVGGTFFTQGGAMSGLFYGSYSDQEADQAAVKYLGDKNNACQSLKDSKESANYLTCKTSRNLQAKEMADLEKMLVQAQTRTMQIDTLLKAAKTSGLSGGALQQKTIEMMGLQALLQNDLTKLQLTLAMYQQREKLYQQQQADNVSAMLNSGDKPVSLKDALTGLGNGFQSSLN